MDQQSNTETFCAKYLRIYVSFSRHERRCPKLGSRIPKRGLMEEAIMQKTIQFFDNDSNDLGKGS